MGPGFESQRDHKREALASLFFYLGWSKNPKATSRTPIVTIDIKIKAIVIFTLSCCVFSLLVSMVRYLDGYLFVS